MSADGYELTDKELVNQYAALHMRSGLMQQLYAESPSAELIVIEA